MALATDGRCTRSSDGRIAVRTFINNSLGLDSFRQQLANVRDLERTIGRR